MATAPLRPHVGFYLIDRGVPQLERAAQSRHSIAEDLRRMGRRHSLPLYLGAIIATACLLAAGLVAAANAGAAPDALLVLVGILSLLATSQLAVALVNWLATSLVAPQPLPRMDFSEGIPPQFRTLVGGPDDARPSAAAVEELVEALEVRFLANRDANLHFGLLTDFADADRETLPEDEALALLACAGIEELNRQVRQASNFFLFHRPRRWNPQERCWMGYERKRGKLAASERAAARRRAGRVSRSSSATRGLLATCST